jgi:hypothetical protein
LPLCRSLGNVRPSSMDEVSGHLVLRLLILGMKPISETDLVILDKRIVKLHGRRVDSYEPRSQLPRLYEIHEKCTYVLS